MEMLEVVRNLEAELAGKRREVATSLRASREALGLSLFKAGQKVRLTPGALYNIETGKSWRTKTVERIARCYDRLAA